jgi:hypothetical protein
MRGISELIKEHNELIRSGKSGKDFLRYHLRQIKFLQQERLAHLLVMLSVILFALIFLALYYQLNNILFLLIFSILIILTVFYIFHYFRLENTLIKWYFYYNEKAEKDDYVK